MSFPPSFLDELRSRVGLADLVGRKVKLVRKGREHSGLCPFHNEKTPSFYVNEEKGFYHCFGCGAHGDAIGFVMQTEGLSFPEAIGRLADLAGLKVPDTSPAERERAKVEASLHQVVEAAAKWYEAALHGPAGRAGRAYVERRGLSEDTIRRFRLGFAPDDRNALKRALLAQDITEDQMVEAGLLIRPDDGRPAYDRFRGRVMFPIADGRGRIIAFGGRVIGDGEPKYLNSPDTPLFHKGRVLYGYGAARRAAADRRRLIVVEGYMDVIALSQAGFAETVAPLGTALTEDQLALAWRAAPEVVLCFDGDAAGQRAALRAIDRALPLVGTERSARVVTLPQGEDPDSLTAKGGAAAFEAVIAAARPLSEAIWGVETQGGGFDTPEARAGLIDRLRQWAKKIGDRTLQQQFEAFFDDRVAGLTPARPQFAGRGRFSGRRRDGWGRPAVLPGHVARPPDSLLRHRREQVLMAGLVNHAGLVEEFADDLGKVNLSDPKLDKLRQEILKISARDAGLDVPKLARHLLDQGFAEILQSLGGPEIARVHGPFTKAEAPEDEAREGVRQALMFLMRSQAAFGGAASAVSHDRSDGPFEQG